MIAFVGSVFSPYYAWSRSRNPEAHCALNVALYGGRSARWTMTERTEHRVQRSADRFEIGPSHLNWEDGRLTIHVREYAAPIPRPVRGMITIDTGPLVQPPFNKDGFRLDSAGRHTWRPLAPAAKVTVAFDDPALCWSGRGYLDMNWGTEPLEDGFRFWDWSRFELDDGEAAILYRTEPRASEGKLLALHCDRDGRFTPFDVSDAGDLPRTRYWRIRRPALSQPDVPVRLVRTFEDTPFYSRSQVATPLFGAVRRGIHESFDGNRLRRNMIRALLPVRMPRRR